jgi:glycosyltransferase involved in cell wall biosynthesis
MNPSKSVIVVISNFPFPAHHGGSFDVFERMVGLKNLGFNIDIICTCKDQPDPKHIVYMNTLVDNVFIVKRENKLSQLFHISPLQVVSRKALRNFNFNKAYHYAILETEHVGIVLENETFRAQKIFLRLQNNESYYFRQLAQSTNSIFEKIYYLSDAVKFKFYSKKIFKKADRLWFISNEEIKSKHKNKVFLPKSVHLPPPINSEFSRQKLDNKNVLYIASLSMPNNIEALDWYLKDIHSKLLSEFPDYKLIIVGSIDVSEITTIKNKYSKYDGVEINFNVPDLNHFYSVCSLFINPMQHGAGVKLKTINAIVNGLPVVSTSIGAEGIGLTESEMYFLGNSKNDFYDKIYDYFRLDNSKRHRSIEKAQHFLRQNNYLSILKDEMV